MKREDLVWRDRKRNFLGLPWTFTVYSLNNDRLFIETGLINSREDEVRLYRITDMTMTRSLWQKIIGTGTLHCDSADPTMKNFDIKNVKYIREVKEQLSQLVEESRQKNRVYAKENLHAGGPGHPDLDDNFDLDPEDYYENH